MILNQKFSIKFWLNSQRAKNELAPIYIQISLDGNRSNISTSYFVDPKNWNKKAMRLTTTDNQSKLINSELGKTFNDLEQIYTKALINEEPITAADIKDRFLGTDTAPQEKEKTILDIFEYHNLKMEEQLKIGKIASKTYIRYVITKKKIEAFMKYQYKRTDMNLSEIRFKFASEFDHYLITMDRVSTNTAHKYIKNLKKVMNLAVAMEWLQVNPVNQFKCSYEAPERIVLTQEELDTLIQKDFGIERLNEVRDIFIFCCYTGFAYVDVYKFPYNAVSKGIDGNTWLSTSRQKTGTKENVPLLPIPLEIIEKYRDHPYCLRYDKLLPVNSNQRYNGYLKEIAEICGIKKKITTHIARHTFATTVTLANGVPIETVSAMLGHKDIRTTQIYAKVLEQKVSQDMELLKNKLFNTPIKEDQRFG